MLTRGVRVAPLALVGLLVCELLYLTVSFDSQALDHAESAWLRFVSWSPQYLRLAITVVVVGLLLGGRSLVARLLATPAPPRTRLAALAVHLVAVTAFFRGVGRRLRRQDRER